MTPPTDSAPGWTTILTGATHEQCNVWWNEFVGHDLARHPDILSQIFFANPLARTIAAATWDAFVSPYGPGPIIHQRVDQQRTGQHQLFSPDLSEGIDRADEQVSSWAAWHLLHEGPDAAVVYFEGVDHAGHSYGADSEQYRQAVRHVDELTRHLVKQSVTSSSASNGSSPSPPTTGTNPREATARTRLRCVGVSWQLTTSVGHCPIHCFVPIPFAATN